MLGGKLIPISKNDFRKYPSDGITKGFGYLKGTNATKVEFPMNLNNENWTVVYVTRYDPDGKDVNDGAFYGDVGEEIAASLRKKLYEKADLNFITITSVKKEGFFTRNQPKFEVNDGVLDVSNKSKVSAKLIGINLRRIEYLDEDGDLWDRGNYAGFLGLGGVETTSDDKEKRKEARKSARILNINFGNKFFLNTRALYDYFYNEYEKNFYQSLEDFKNDYIGMNVKDLLKDWGPNSQLFELDSNTFEYVWVFERTVTDKESSTTGTMSSIKKALTKSTTESTGSISTSYGINTNASKYNLGGYGSIMNSYTKVNKNSFLNYYSTNVTSQYSQTQTSFSSQTRGTDISVDDSKKIGVIVNKDLIVTDVLEKNYFPTPYYGVEIRFVED